MARQNAGQAFLDRKRTKDETEAVLGRLQKSLHLSRVAAADGVLRHLALPGLDHRRLARWR